MGYCCRVCGEEVILRFDARAAVWYSVCPNCGLSVRIEVPVAGNGAAASATGERAEVPRRLGLGWGGRRP